MPRACRRAREESKARQEPAALEGSLQEQPPRSGFESQPRLSQADSEPGVHVLGLAGPLQREEDSHSQLWLAGLAKSYSAVCGAACCATRISWPGWVLCAPPTPARVACIDVAEAGAVCYMEGHLVDATDPSHSWVPGILCR